MRITRKMKRERKNAVNPLEELLIIIKQYFPKLTSWIDNLTDERNQSYVTYDYKICFLTQVLAFCSSYQSMNSIGRDFNSDIVINNINNILKTNYVELPHKDTLINIFSSIDYDETEKIQTNIIRTLIRSKMFDKYRFYGLFHVVIDGTGLYSTRVNLGEKAITKVHNKGTENEYTTYSYYALEAKLICGNMAFSLATEFVENETYKDKDGNEYKKFEKQDCELKAAYRLLEKIKKRFPKLPIIIGGDALYLGRPFFELCDKLNFDYIVRYKSTDAPSIQRNFDEIKLIDNDYEYQNEIIFGDMVDNQFYTVNVVSYDEETIDEKTNKTVTTNFSFVTSLKLNKRNKEDIVKLGRRRWKIENKGFKEQKSDILNITHIYSKNCNATKNLYLIIQFAHTLLNLLYYGNVLIIDLNTTKNEVSSLIKQALTSININLNLKHSIQLRLP